VRFGVDGAVHNEDSAVLLGEALSGTLGKVAPFGDDPRFAVRAKALVASTGLVGMHLRGEVGSDAFAGIHAALRAEDGDETLGRVWSMVNAFDTGAVRAGLWTDLLAAAFRRVEDDVCGAATIGALRELSLAERIAHFRGGAIVDAGQIEEASRALDRLGVAKTRTIERLARCRTWYAEAALGALSLDASVRLLALVAGVAAGSIADLSKPWNLDLLGIVSELRDGKGAPREYPVRVLEAILASTADEDLLEGRLPGRALVSFPARKGSEDAVLVRLDPSEEARALLTLLPIYEKKEAAAFHASLKALCDLYGLRKDDFDRVSNEASYLATMNAARSDKSRMIDLVVPGLVVEVGPGGGVVLDLIEDRSPTGRVVGLDSSSAVVEALKKRRSAEGRRWEVVHGDAFKLPELFGRGTVSTVVFCAVLHEIFSYVPWSPEPGAPPRRFCLESVDAIVAASFRALRPGGRIVVRDGVMPKREMREIEFLDAEWREGLDVFAARYEARKIPFHVLSKTRVRMDAADLFEFLTTWTWGPSAFPYEIREQRAVLPRAEYVQRLLGVCAKADPPHSAHEVPVPPDLASYLQPGYPAGIGPHLRIFDVEGNEVPMPDVNGVWVIEKG
jgi:SAM-dependent methyltransferase